MSIISSLKSFLLQCARVWTVTKKPTKEEFRTTAQAAGIGIIIIGAIGFIISIAIRILKG